MTRPFDPASFYELATFLRRGSNGDDARLRSCISRAYYGAFIVARDAAKISSEGQDGHSRVIRYYEDGTTALDEVVADSLRTLKKLRQRADYAPDLPCATKSGDEALRLSEKVLKVLRRPAKP